MECSWYWGFIDLRSEMEPLCPENELALREISAFGGEARFTYENLEKPGVRFLPGIGNAEKFAF